MKIGIRNKIILINTIIIIIGTFLFSWYALFILRDYLIEHHVNDLEYNGSQNTKKLVDIFNFSELHVKSLANNDVIQQYFSLSKQEIQDEKILNILNLYNVNDMYSAIYLLDEVGLTYVSTDESFIGKNYSFREYFIESIKGKPSIYMAVGVTSKQPGYYFSNPIYDVNNKIAGVAVMKLRTEIINNTLNEIDSYNATNYMVTDINGVIIFSDVEDRVYKSLGNLSITDDNYKILQQKFSQEEIDSIQYQIVQDAIDRKITDDIFNFKDNIDGKEELLILKKVGKYPFYYIGEHNIYDINRLINSFYYTFILVIIITIFVIIIFISVILKRFLQPLYRLKEYSKGISEGKFDKKIIINSNDEFEDLSLAFNQMTDKLSEYYRTLERKIQERTQELMDSVYQYEEQNENLKKTKKAMINLLEDARETEEDLVKEKNVAESIINSVGEGLVVTNKDGKIILLNPRARDVLGSGWEKFIGKDIRNVFVLYKKDKLVDKKNHPVTITLTKKLFYNASMEEDYYYHLPSNKDFPVIFNIAQLKNSFGKVTGLVNVFRDVSVAKNLDKSKTEFISVASHQLRTPLTAIKWIGEMLSGDSLGKMNKEQEEFLNDLNASTERMIALVNGLLNTARLEASHIGINPKSFSIKKLLNSIIKELEPSINKKKHKIIKNINPEIKKLNTDYELLFEVIKNLLSNSIKYTNPGGKIEIKIVKKSDDYVFEVKDNGFGIPLKQQEKIFKKFFRADNVMSHDTEGTGLGLYIVQNIVRLLGGKIWFKSVENKGTSFYFTVPIKPPKKIKGTKKLS